MAFDEGRGRVLLYGGHDGERVLGDLWSFEGGQWKRLEATEPLKRIDNGH